MEKKERNDRAKALPGDLVDKILAAGAAVVLSEDRVLRDEIIEELRASVPDPKEVRAREAKTTSLAEMKVELASPSLFSPFTITILNRVHECPAEQLRQFKELVDAGITGNLLLFSGEKLPATSVFLKKMQSLGVVIQREKLSGEPLERWASEEVKRRGLRLEREAMGLLLRASEESADSFSQMLEKLDLYQGDDISPIQLETVNLLFTTPLEAHEFELADAIMAKDVVRMELLVTTLISSGKSPFTIIPLLARTFSNYAVIALALKRNIPAQEIRERLNITPWVFNKYLPIARRYPPRAFTRHSRSLLLADSKIKNRSLGPEMILSELLQSLTILE